MKNRWFKKYPMLHKRYPNRKFQANVRNSVMNSINLSETKGTDNMNLKKPVKWLSVAIAIAVLGTASVVGVNASTNGELMNKIKVFINGQEVDGYNYIKSSIDQDGNQYYSIEIGESDTDTLEENFIFSNGTDSETVDDISISIYMTTGKPTLEIDENNHLWLTYEDGIQSMDITEELTKNGSYEYTYVDENGNLTKDTITGTVDNYSIETNILNSEEIMEDESISVYSINTDDTVYQVFEDTQVEE